MGCTNIAETISVEQTEAFLIKLITDSIYVNDESDRDILFMAFRVLNGYEKIERIGDRREKYIFAAGYLNNSELIAYNERENKSTEWIQALGKARMRLGDQEDKLFEQLEHKIKTFINAEVLLVYIKDVSSYLNDDGTVKYPNPSYNRTINEIHGASFPTLVDFTPSASIKNTERLDSMFETFPNCNILHNGLIEYLPTLLAVTPLAYTYIIVSDKGSDNIGFLNSLSPNCHKWLEYDLASFMDANIIDSKGKVALFVNVHIADTYSLEQMLDHRKRYFRDMPIVINIYGDDIAEEKLRRITNSIVDSYHFELITQTLDTLETLLPACEKITHYDSDVCWRILLSSPSYDYYKFAVERSQQREARFLLSQFPDDFKDPNEKLEADYCAEIFDHQAFKLKSIKEALLGRNIR